MLDGKIHCAICGSEKNGDQRWLLLMENQWEDKLCILHWDSMLALQPGAFPACCPLHARDMAARWMVTGSLSLRPADSVAEAIPCQFLEAGNIRQIGELAVHHENLRRLLDEEPQSTKSVLDALFSALEYEFAAAAPEHSFTEPSSLLKNQHANPYLYSTAH